MVATLNNFWISNFVALTNDASLYELLTDSERQSTSSGDVSTNKVRQLQSGELSDLTIRSRREV